MVAPVFFFEESCKYGMSNTPFGGFERFERFVVGVAGLIRKTHKNTTYVLRFVGVFLPVNGILL